MHSIACKSLRLGLCLLISGFLSGCVSRVAFEAEPAWYALSSGPYLVSGQRLFYGIGTAAGAGSATLMRVTADNRARKEMVRVLTRYLGALSRLSPSMRARPAEERAQITGRLLQHALARAVISDHWSQADGPRKSMFALCEMPLDSFKAVLQADAALDRALRAELLARAEAVHAQLSQNFQTDNQ